MEIGVPDDLAYTNERHLAPFSVETVKSPRCFRFELMDPLTPPVDECIANEGGFRVYPGGDGTARYIGSVQQSWEPAYLRVSHHGREHHVQVKRSLFTDRIEVHTVLNCLSAESLIVQAGGFIFHSSYIECSGKDRPLRDRKVHPDRSLGETARREDPERRPLCRPGHPVRRAGLRHSLRKQLSIL